MSARIVGIDCAVQPTKVGIALASLEGRDCHVIDARKCSAKDQPANAIHEWYQDGSISLIALDAPLGWPDALSRTLPTHEAGRPIDFDANCLFRRTTDKEIRERLGKQPLDVGANFIARTAKAALALLEELRRLTGESIPLAWKMSIPDSTCAIEVYPAATIRSLSLPIVDYKKPSQSDGRKRILESLPDWFDVSAANAAAVESPDVLDAILCVLAAVEFCNGRAVPPKNQTLAKKEGWIWAGARQ